MISYLHPLDLRPVLLRVRPVRAHPLAVRALAVGAELDGGLVADGGGGVQVQEGFGLGSH